jgi:hypothetical protein
MTRRLRRLAPGAAALVLLTACPQLFLYDIEEATIDSETVETTTPEAAQAPTFGSQSVLGGASGAPTIFRDTDQLISLASATSGAEIFYTLTTDGSMPPAPNPFANNGTLAYVTDSPLMEARDDTTRVRIRAMALRAQFYPSEIAELDLQVDYAQVSTPTFAPTLDTAYTNTVQVAIASQTSGAQLWYQLSVDGGPLSAPVAYAGPVDIDGLFVTHAFTA